MAINAVIREKNLDALAEMQALITRYKNHDGYFIEKTIEWMEKLEEDLGKLRQPIVGELATERGKIAAIMDGKPTEFTGKTKRKRAAYQAIESIDIIGGKLQIIIENIDIQFATWRDKIAQLFAIAANSIELDIGDPSNQNDLSILWQKMGTISEAYNLHKYVSASLSNTDLLYLLREVIFNVIANTETPV